MKLAPSIVKAAGLAIAGGLGFAIGSWGEARIQPTGSSDAGGEAGRSPVVESTATRTTRQSTKTPKITQRAQFLNHLASCDLGDFPAILMKELETEMPTERLSVIVETWIERDLEGHAAWLETQPENMPFGNSSNTSFHLHGILLHTLQKEDPAAALAMANRLKTNERARWEILTSTLEKDPAKALELARAHPDINARPKMHYGTNDQGVDPMLALPVLNALHPGGGRTALVHDGSNYYASRPEQIEAAAQWFRQLPPGAQRQVVHKLDRRQFFGNPSEETRERLSEVWRLPEDG